jgi:trans-aconitate methyltransferase
MKAPAKQTWSTETYERNARFVSDYGLQVVDLLAPQRGERILDLGCGDGVLTMRIVESGADVVGADGSEAFVTAARARGLDVRHVDGQALEFNREFDAVFSNAALHWMLEPDRVIDGVARALRPGGRFVGEFGGHGNIAAIDTALRAAFTRRGLVLPHLSYFPSVDEYSRRLTNRGFEIEYMALIPRPTPLPTGMAGWLETFRHPMISALASEDQRAITEEAIELLRPALCDSDGRWTADYVRLRFAARLKQPGSV